MHMMLKHGSAAESGKTEKPKQKSEKSIGPSYLKPAETQAGEYTVLFAYHSAPGVSAVVIRDNRACDDHPRYFSTPERFKNFLAELVNGKPLESVTRK
jgi:hypothetical protein